MLTSRRSRFVYRFLRLTRTLEGTVDVTAVAAAIAAHFPPA